MKYNTPSLVAAVFAGFLIVSFSILGNRNDLTTGGVSFFAIFIFLPLIFLISGMVAHRLTKISKEKGKPTSITSVLVMLGVLLPAIVFWIVIHLRSI